MTCAEEESRTLLGNRPAPVSGATDGPTTTDSKG
jgi:hypothetical protein